MMQTQESFVMQLQKGMFSKTEQVVLDKDDDNEENHMINKQDLMTSRAKVNYPPLPVFQENI